MSVLQFLKVCLGLQYIDVISDLPREHCVCVNWGGFCYQIGSLFIHQKKKRGCLKDQILQLRRSTVPGSTRLNASAS